jgi:hypothetical protein
MEFIAKIGQKHEELKKRIHAFRIPLSPRGQMVMKFVYFMCPLIGGYYLMQVCFCWPIDVSDRSLAVT